MLHREVLLPVVGEGLVEGRILILGDVLSLSHPDGLGLVKSLELVGDFLYLLLLLVLRLLLIFFDLGLIFLLVSLVVVFLIFLIIRLGDFLILRFLDEELNGETDELGVLLDEVLKATLFNELDLVLLHVEDDLGATGKSLTFVFVDGESATSVGLPSVLLVVVGLGDDSDSLSNKVSRVEADTELTDHRNISSSGDGLHECLSA